MIEAAAAATLTNSIILMDFAQVFHANIQETRHSGMPTYQPR
jgi:hypothetical protein